MTISELLFVVNHNVVAQNLTPCQPPETDVAVYDFEKSVNLFKFINGINVT